MWDQYGVVSSVPSVAPYNILFPAVWDVISVSGAPWVVGGGAGHALRAQAVNGPATTSNPGSGVYAKPKWAGLQAMNCGFWFFIQTLPSSSVAFFRMNDSHSTVGSQVPPQGVDQSYLSLNSSALITSQNASNVSHGTYTISTGVWHFMEVYYLIGDPSGGTNKQGAMQLNVDGVAQITNSNCATRYTPTGSFYIDNVTFDCEFDQTCVLYFGPWYWLDPQGAGAGAFFGKQVIQKVAPVSTSGSTPFSVQGGSRIANVATLPPVGGNYNYDATQGDVEVYTPGSIGVATINAVMAQLEVAQNGRGGRMCAPTIQSGATTKPVQGMSTPGGPVDDSTGFQIRRAITTTDPNTGLAWTSIGIANAKIGEEVFQ